MYRRSNGKKFQNILDAQPAVSGKLSSFPSTHQIETGTFQMPAQYAVPDAALQAIAKSTAFSYDLTDYKKGIVNVEQFRKSLASQGNARKDLTQYFGKQNRPAMLHFAFGVGLGFPPLKPPAPVKSEFPSRSKSAEQVNQKKGQKRLVFKPF